MQEQDLQLKNALLTAKQAERAADIGPTKRRDNAFLARYIAFPVSTGAALRPLDAYRARSYNLSRQVTGLIDHLLVRYPVPLYLYRSVLTGDGLELVFGDNRFRKARQNTELPDTKYRSWFYAVGRGDSFAKVAKDVFSKREAHWFLKAPATNSIEMNILWARCAAAGVPLPGCDYLAQRIDATTLKRIGDRLPDVLRFYAQAWEEMRGYDCDEITDFIRAAALDAEFSFKGRTCGSMRKLCHEWHRTVYSGTVREYHSWVPMLPLWESHSPGRVVRALELTSNRALQEEGRKQHHCVYTYTQRCLHGQSRIVSLRWYAVASREETPNHELSRLTIEVSPGQHAIVQVRGSCNARATDEQMKVLCHWSGELGLRLSQYA